MTRTVLIVGATGGIGSETARALLARGWTVKALNRAPEEAAQRFAALGKIRLDPGRRHEPGRRRGGRPRCRRGDARSEPAGLSQLGGPGLAMLESSIAAAKAAQARLVFPGTVYNFGPEVFPLVAESAPQRPRTRKGAIRVAMEQRLAEAAQQACPC